MKKKRLETAFDVFIYLLCAVYQIVCKWSIIELVEICISNSINCYNNMNVGSTLLIFFFVFYVLTSFPLFFAQIFLIENSDHVIQLSISKYLTNKCAISFISNRFRIGSFVQIFFFWKFLLLFIFYSFRTIFWMILTKKVECSWDWSIFIDYHTILRNSFFVSLFCWRKIDMINIKNLNAYY